MCAPSPHHICTQVFLWGITKHAVSWSGNTGVAGTLSWNGKGRRREDEELYCQVWHQPCVDGKQEPENEFWSQPGAYLVLGKHEESIRGGRSVGFSTPSQWLPASMIWFGGGIQPLWEGKRMLSIWTGVVAPSVLQPMYFPRGLKNFLTDMMVSISKPKRAYALRMRASGYLCPYISFSSPPSHGIMGSGSVHINSPTMA